MRAYFTVLLLYQIVVNILFIVVEELKTPLIANVLVLLFDDLLLELGDIICNIFTFFLP